MTNHKSAYDKHWERLAKLLGPEEAAAERARMTADESADRRRKKLARFRTEVPRFKQYLAQAEADYKHEYAARLRKQIAYREQVIAQEESTETARPE